MHLAIQHVSFEIANERIPFERTILNQFINHRCNDDRWWTMLL